MAQKEFDDARAAAGYTQSSSYREVDSYTTADGTRYSAIASNKRTQIIKTDAEGNKTYLAIHSKKGSRSSNANRVAGEFAAFKEGLEAAEAGQNITYTDDDVNAVKGDGGFLGFGGDAASTVTLSNGTVLSSASGNTGNEVTTIKRLADEIANTSAASTSTTTTTEEEEIDDDEEITEEDLTEVGIDAGTYNSIVGSGVGTTGTGGISGNYTIEPGYFPTTVTSNTAIGTARAAIQPKLRKRYSNITPGSKPFPINLSIALNKNCVNKIKTIISNEKINGMNSCLTIYLVKRRI